MRWRLRVRRRGITQRVLDIETRTKLADSSSTLYTPEDKGSKYPIILGWVDPQICSIRCGKMTFFSFGIRRFLCPPVCKVATILTELAGFSNKTPRTPLPAVLSSCWLHQTYSSTLVSPTLQYNTKPPSWLTLWQYPSHVVTSIKWTNRQSSGK